MHTKKIGSRELFDNELRIYKESLRDDNCSPRLLSFDKNSLTLVTEKFGINLKEYLLSEKRTQFNKKEVFRQCVECIKSMHSKGVIHGDIKLDNFLINEEGNIKIIDFGLSIKKIDKKSSLIKKELYSKVYRPPEVEFNSEINQKSDIWALGCLLLSFSDRELLPIVRNVKTMLYNGFLTHLDYPLHEFLKLDIGNFRKFYGENIKDHQIIEKLFGYRFSNDLKCLDLLKKILKLNPEERISTEEILKHEWFY